MKKTILFALITFVALYGVTFAKGPLSGGPMLPMGKWWRMPEISEKLNLTKEEKVKLDTLFLESRKKMIDLRSHLGKEKLALEEILEKDPLDASACMAQFQKVQEARNNMVTGHFEFLLEVRKLLGTERFQQLKMRFNERRMKRMRGFKNPDRMR